MNDEHNNSQPQLELEWLAQYYYARGFKDKAREIIERLKGTRPCANVIEMFENEEERRA